MSCKMYDHITPVLINLHWLPVIKDIELILKFYYLLSKPSDGMAPSYIIDLIHTKTCLVRALTAILTATFLSPKRQQRSR